MSKSSHIYLKVGTVVALLAVLLSVLILGRRTDVDRKTEIKLKNIMTRNQIHLVCLPHTESESYDYALKEWQKMNYSKAYQSFMGIKEEQEKYNSKSAYEVAAINHALGCLCLDIGKYGEAYELLNSAFVTMTDLYGESSTATLAVLSSIVYYDYITGELEQCLKDARAICDATPPLAIWAVTNRVQMLVYYDCGENTMAIRGTYVIIDNYMKEQDESFTWDDALSLQEYLTQPEKEELDQFGCRLLTLLSWDIGNGYAAIAPGANVEEKAEKWYETSLFISQNLLDEETVGLPAQVMADRAHLFGKCGEKETAFSLIEQAMGIQENLGGPDNICPDLVKTYCTYGEMLSFLSDDRASALEYFEKARALSESIYGLYNKKTAQTYFLLGKYYAIQSDYEKSLEYLKQCEEIKKNTLLLNDTDAINLYMYLAAVYNARGELELVDDYKQRANETSDYLKVHILSIDDRADSVKPSDSRELPQDNFDLLQYKEGENWKLAIDEYVNAVQTGDADMLMDSLQIKFVELVPTITATQLGVQIDVDKIIALYKDFYQSELLSQKNELVDCFGDRYSIRFEPYSVEYMEDHDINSFNDYLFKCYDSEIVLKDAVVISGRFFVSTSRGTGEEEVTGSMLCQSMPILDVNGEWKLGIPDGFPKLPQEALADALGISLPKEEGGVENDG